MLVLSLAKQTATQKHSDTRLKTIKKKNTFSSKNRNTVLLLISMFGAGLCKQPASYVMTCSFFSAMWIVSVSVCRATVKSVGFPLLM